MMRSRPVSSSAPSGYRFPREGIAVAVRWYLRYGLSYRDVEELLAERGIEVDHVTVYPLGAPIYPAARRVATDSRAMCLQIRSVVSAPRGSPISLGGGLEGRQTRPASWTRSAICTRLFIPSL